MKTLENYICHLKNFFPRDLCKEVIDFSLNSDWHDHTWQTSRENKIKLYDKELEVYYLNNLTEGLRNKVFFYSMVAIDEYQMRNQTNVGVSFINDYRMNRYTKGSTMRPHVDHIHDLFDGKKKGIPILSIIVNLNESYTGGDLIFFDDLKFSLKTGDVILFPSNFMYPHAVSSVDEGTRYSIVSWGY
jgi:predicted 2-oxoglutarate/Fe(II)-dependent dioxygenase YbiX